jgi:hypothetical protein
MARTARHLRVLDEQGEVHDRCPECAAKELEQTELTRKLKAMARELGELRRDRHNEAIEHEKWPILFALFCLWQDETGHVRSRWTTARFWEGLPLLDAWGVGNFAAAIAGLAYDPGRKQLKNGKWEIYDSWELLTRNSDTFSRYMKRRPAGWELPETLKQYA